jgi:hypothetical protein
LLVVLALAPPFVLRAFGSGVGSFSMFTGPVRYHLRIIVERPDGGREQFPVRALEPHLGRDARRIVLPAEQWFVGETHAELVAGGLDDLGLLVCRLRPARAVDIVMDRHSVDDDTMLGQVAHVRCP